MNALQCYNSEGLWVKLDQSSQRKFCFTSDGEAWSLAIGTGDITYLRRLGKFCMEIKIIRNYGCYLNEFMSVCFAY